MEEGKAILVTGASRGIGRALAVAAVRAGHHVVLNYRSDAEATKALAADLDRGPGRAFALQADVGDPQDAARLVEVSVERMGRLDCVVNNAGSGSVIALEALQATQFSQILHANLTSAFLVAQAAWPRMTTRGGRLVFLSSGAARRGPAAGCLPPMQRRRPGSRA